MEISPAIRLFISVVLAYPFAAAYHVMLLHPSKYATSATRNAYCLLVGVGLFYFYCANDILHSFATICASYAICALLGLLRLRAWAGAVGMIFNMAYLLWGYHISSTEQYDINWTIPQCVLCLRLIGFCFDYADGRHRLSGDETSSKTSNAPISFPADSALVDLPPFVQVLGYAYFFPSCIIGPQFAFRLYEKFLNNQHLPDNSNGGSGGLLPGGCILRTVKCLAIGAFYLGIYELLNAKFNSALVLTDEYSSFPLWKRYLLLPVICKAIIYKYFGIWNFGEGSAVLTGISFNGFNLKGEPQWDGLNNLNPWGFETATLLGTYVNTFNINTNHWSKRYLYKRLMFLGNKNLSALFTLAFLAVWHGTHPGYFLCFGMEFLGMEAERRLIGLLSVLKSTPLSFLATLIHWIFTLFIFSYSILVFDLLTFEKSWKAWQLLGFSGTWLGAAVIALDIGLAVTGLKKRLFSRNEKKVVQVEGRKDQ